MYLNKKNLSFKKQIFKNIFESKRFSSSLLSGKKRELQNITIGQFLTNHSEKNPYKDWLRYCPLNDLRWTYEDFLKIIDAFAAGFLDSRGRDVFTGLLENDSDNIITQFACARANIKYASLSPNSEKEKLRKVLQETNSRALIVNEKHKERNNLRMVEEIVPYLTEWPFGVPLKVKEYPNLKMIVQTSHPYRNGFLSLRDLGIRNAISNPIPSLQNSIQSNSVSSIFLGGEKGIAFSHSSLVNNSLYTSELLEIGSQDRILVDLPLWESYGQTAGILSPYSTQSLVVIASNLFNEEVTLKKLYEEKITTLFTTPSQSLLLLQHPNFSKYKKDFLKKIFIVSSSSDRASPQLLTQLQQAFSLEDIHFAFSVDHFAGISFHGKLTQNPSNLNATPAGQLLPNLEAKIVDNSGKSVAQGTKGNLFLKGHNLFSGYYSLTQLEKPSLDSHGFFNTNLQASVDSNGFFSIY